MTNTLAAGWRAWRLVYLAVAAITLAAHLPEIGGWVTCNPIYGYSGMVLAAPIHLLPGRCSLDGNDGTTLQALGGRAAEMWLHGSLPWWNSLAGLGLPLAAEAQPAAFFLPFVLLLHFFGGMLMLKIAMQMLAGAYMVALLRELRIGPPAAAAGATLFALNGSFAWFAHSPILPIAFLPALLFGLERCRTAAITQRPGGPALVALALAFSLLAGFPETAFMDGVLAALWAGVALLRTQADRRWTLLGKIVCGGLAGLALSAPAWVSFMDYLRISSVGIHGMVSGNQFALNQTAALLMPSIYGPPYAQWVPNAWSDDGGYFGPALATLAMLGVCSGRQRAAIRVAMAAWIMFWLSVFLGAPVTHAIWIAWPPFNEVQVTRYAMPSIECAATVLAALGVEHWCRTAAGLRTAWVTTALATAGAVTVLLGALAGRLSLGWGVLQIFYVAALVEAAMLVACLAWLMARPPSRRRLLGLAALVAIDAAGNFMVPEAAGTMPNRLALAQIAFLQAHAGRARFFALAEQIPTNYGSWFGVAQIQADSMPFAQAWDDAAVAVGGDINMGVTGWLVITPATQRAALRTALPRLGAAGVRYIVVAAASDPFAAQPEPGVNQVFADPHTRIYEMENAAAYVEVRGGPCAVDVAARELVHTTCAAPAVLVRRELLLAGWHASINGRKAVLSPGIQPNEAHFQQMSLPAGGAEIRWWYTPPHAMAIALLFGTGVLTTLGMTLRALRRS